MSNTVLFEPLISWQILYILAAIFVLTTGFAAWRGLSGWLLRGLGALVILVALASPVLHREDRAPLSDVVLLVEDATAAGNNFAIGLENPLAHFVAFTLCWS